MSREHDLKTWPQPFAAVRRGEKTHEVRGTTDRVFEVGDALVLREFVPCSVCLGAGATCVHDPMGLTTCPSCNGTEGDYTGEREKVAVTHVTRGGTFGLPPHLCVMSIRRAAR